MRIFGYTQHGGPEVASFLDVPEPTAGAGEILIEVQATSVNPGDLATRNGANAMPVTFPMAMGREAAGRVLALGAGVQGFDVGDVVFGSSATGHGAFGERALLNASASALVPTNLSVIDAACIPVAYATAHDVLDHFELGRGDSIAVIGAGGGVGLAITSLGRARGVRVIGVSSESKREIVEKLGGEHVVSGEGFADRVREIVDKPGALLDLVGGETLDEAAALVGGHRLISVADPERAQHFGGSGIERRRTTEIYGEVAQILADGEAEVVIGRVFPFEQAAEAVAVVEDGHSKGKVVITGTVPPR